MCVVTGSLPIIFKGDNVASFYQKIRAKVKGRIQSRRYSFQNVSEMVSLRGDHRRGSGLCGNAVPLSDQDFR